jgi:hypothetical protein
MQTVSVKIASLLVKHEFLLEKYTHPHEGGEKPSSRCIKKTPPSRKLHDRIRHELVSGHGGTCKIILHLRLKINDVIGLFSYKLRYSRPVFDLIMFMALTLSLGRTSAAVNAFWYAGCSRTYLRREQEGQGKETPRST